jgi:hypothetical protein
VKDQYGHHIPKLVGMPAMSDLRDMFSDDDLSLAINVLDNMEWYEDEAGHILVPDKDFKRTGITSEIFEACPSFRDLNRVSQRRYRGEITSIAFSLYRYSLVDGFYHA